MKTSVRWLRDLAPDLDASPDALAERLTSLGFPVEETRDLAAGLGDIVVARVTRVDPHPNADRLRVCRVDDGTRELQVVCGAPNVVAGGWYPFAPVGATLPGGMRIGKAKLRGQLSEGMLCSEVELGLGRGKEGLMELGLDPADPDAPRPFDAPGTSLVRALGLGDVRLDVEVTSNRPDLLSHRGIARELAPAGEASLVSAPHPEAVDDGEGVAVAEFTGEGTAAGVTIRIEAGDRCPRYLGLAVRGVRIGPSPSWLRTRLRAVGARPINNVVDATNLVLLEWGQPLHAFDLDRLEDRTIVVRQAREGDTIRTLDGVDRALSPEMLAICDAERPVAIAGVIGGEDSEVTAATTNLLLECALFTPGPIRATRNALGLSTDASYRFERGVDPDALVPALLRCVEIILATAGGTPDGPVLDVATTRHTPARVTLRTPRIEKVLGVAFDADRVTELLEPLGFQVEAATRGRDAVTRGEDAAATDDDHLVVTVPGWRSWDVTREVDLIEEIARRHGYDLFPDTLAPFRTGTVPDHPLFALEDRLRALLAGRGFLEAQTPAFAPADEGVIEVLNPISVEESRLRSDLLPALLRRVDFNLARGNRDVRLFEIGTIFRERPAPGELPEERTHLAIVIHGRRAPVHWSGDPGEVDIWEVKGMLEEIIAAIPGGGLRARGAASPRVGFMSGRSIVIEDEEESVVGIGGAVDPARLDLPPWAGTVWGIELTLPSMPPAAEVPRHHPIPALPGVERDLALIVPDARPVGDAIAVIEGHGGSWFRGAEIFDLYRGQGVPDGSRSVAVRLRFRADGRSLTDAEVDDAVKGITSALDREIDVHVRGGTDAGIGGGAGEETGGGTRGGTG